jgi:FKBP-type peptidyl-prolyl cis-trans isomerase FkpA
MLRTCSAVLLILIATACGEDRPEAETIPGETAEPVPGEPEAPATDPDATDPAQLSYSPDLNVDLDRMTRTASGLYIEDLVVGDGEEAQSGDHVEIHYTGWLPTGEEFDSSRGTDPLGFVLGSGMLIPGMEEGVDGMHVGGQRKLVIPSELAYGATGRPPVIPPNATLVFDVELVDVHR